jgi:Zn-dependent protease
MDVDPQRLVFNLVTILIPLILAIAVHEWAHVAMARFLGDRTGEQEGRLTLNPLAHMDPIWTLLVPAFFVFMQTAANSVFPVPFFGAGKPAPYNPVRLDRKFNGKRISMRTGEMLVAAAGPFSNLVLFAITAVLMVVAVKTGFNVYDPKSPANLLFRFALLNVGLCFFNLIPVVPLDGSKILMSLLPRNAAASYERLAQPLSYLMLGVLVFGGASFVLAPIQGFAIRLLLLLTH